MGNLDELSGFLSRAKEDFERAEFSTAEGHIEPRPVIQENPRRRKECGRGNSVIPTIATRYAITAVLAMVFAATPPALHAQTAEAPAAEETATTPAANETATAPALDAAVEVEMQRRFNEFRGEYLDDRAESITWWAESITWWLAVIAIVLTFFGVAVAIVGILGFREFVDIRKEVRKQATEVAEYLEITKGYAEEAKGSGRRAKGYEKKAQKSVKSIKGMSPKDTPNPAEDEEVKKTKESPQHPPEASKYDKAMAQVYSLQKAGKIKEAIKESRAIANSAEGRDNKIAACAWFSVGYLVEESEEQVSAYDHAIRLDPNLAQAYNNRGNAKYNLEQHQAAIADYNEAIRLAPKFADAYDNRGATKAALKQYQAAIEDYNEAIQLNPEDATPYHNRGFAKATLKQYQAAIADFDKAIRLDPEYAAAYYKRGGAKASLEQHQAAIADYNEVIRLAPRLVDPYVNLGVSLRELNRKGEARSNFQIALHLAQATGNEKLATQVTNLIREMDNSETQ